MRDYAAVLAGRDFRRLWLGASLSTVGDGMTLVALSWLVLDRYGTALLGLLAVCATAPVFVGGLVAGPLLDRFDKRTVLAADSVIRGVVVASVPITAAAGRMPSWLPFAVAAVYGLLKMVPMAGVPAAIPDLVDTAGLDAANALESVGYAVSGIVGYALAGTLVAAMGAPNVLALDAASYLLFAVAVRAVRRPLGPHRDPVDAAPAEAATERRLREICTEVPAAIRDGVRGTTWLVRDRVLVVTTLAFMAFNVAEGALVLVTGPWLAKDRLPGGAGMLALLLAALSAGELLGGVLAGAWRPGRDRVKAIAVAQIAAATGFLAVLAVPDRVTVAAGFLLIGLCGVPMTVWAQSLRMERVPARLRGRVFGTLRTLMQATPPIGAALVTPLLGQGHITTAAIGMALVAGLPAVALLLLPGEARSDGPGSRTRVLTLTND
ncbi:MFS transporter [Actinoallomurus sp. CA-150999]|uniref:MFS transporter n=1 Tax=Actinoallomurus sp. CA-150999 TaxID=3239887 RepID=UPI003D8FE3C6